MAAARAGWVIGSSARAGRILILALAATAVQGFRVGPIPQRLPGRCAAGGRACPAARGGFITGVRAAVDISLTLTRPLGIVFEEVVPGEPEGVVVASLEPGGAADRDGRILVGDKLVACSAVVMDDTNGALLGLGGGGAKTSWKRKMIPMGKERFETVMGAIGSNSGRWGYNDVRITVRRTDQSVARSTESISRPSGGTLGDKKDLPIKGTAKDDWS